MLLDCSFWRDDINVSCGPSGGRPDRANRLPIPNDSISQSGQDDNGVSNTPHFCLPVCMFPSYDKTMYCKSDRKPVLHSNVVTGRKYYRIYIDPIMDKLF